MTTAIQDRINHIRQTQRQRAAEEAEIAELPKLLEQQQQAQQQARKAEQAAIASRKFDNSEPQFQADLAENNRRIASLAAQLHDELTKRQILEQVAKDLHLYAAHIADEHRPTGSTGDPWDAGITWLKRQGKWPLMRDDGAGAILAEAGTLARQLGLIEITR